MRLQIQITDSVVMPDKYMSTHFDDEEVMVKGLREVLMALASKFGKVITQELVTGEDSPETVG